MATRTAGLIIAGIWLASAAICVAVRAGASPGVVYSLTIAATVVATVAVLAARLAAVSGERALAASIRRSVPNVGAAYPREGGGQTVSVQEALDWLRGADAGLAADLRALKNERLTAAKLVETVDEPLIVTRPDGRVLMANPAAEQLLNIATGRAAGRALTEIVTRADLLDLHTAARGGAARRAQLRIPRPDGDRLYHVTAAPLSLAPGATNGAAGSGDAGVLLALLDITELAGAGQVKSDFVANASHELRTPIAAIRAAVETLTDAGGSSDPAMRDRLIGMIGEHSLRLERLVGDLLALSRLESPDAAIEISSVPVQEIRAALMNMFDQPCRERRLRLVFEVDPRVGSLRTDDRLLMLILENLIDNATKFAYPETDIRVVFSVAPQPSADSILRGSGGGRSTSERRPAAEGVRIEVIDMGIGIPAGHQQRVFERFYQVDAARTSSARRGTGLGLAIVKHAVKRLDGGVWAKSVWKQGTTMVVDLPGALTPASAADDAGASSLTLAPHEER